MLGAAMGDVMPLKFSDPDIEHQTYVSAFTATLVDKSDGMPLTLDKAVATLHSSGYNVLSIAQHVDEAITCAKTIMSKFVPST